MYLGDTGLSKNVRTLIGWAKQGHICVRLDGQDTGQQEYDIIVQNNVDPWCCPAEPGFAVCDR